MSSRASLHVSDGQLPPPVTVTSTNPFVPTHASSFAQCRALTAVACVAKTAEAKFGKYYDSFIPGIKEIVLAAAPKAGTDPQVRWVTSVR